MRIACGEKQIKITGMLVGNSQKTYDVSYIKAQFHFETVPFLLLKDHHRLFQFRITLYQKGKQRECGHIPQKRGF